MNVHFQYNLNQKQKDEWTEFWESCSHSHPQQHFLFGEIERVRSRIPVYIYGKENDKITVIGIFIINPLFRKNRFSFEAICLRGPVFDSCSAFLKYMREVVVFFKTLKVGSIRVAPYWNYPESKEVELCFKEIGFAPYSIYPNFVNRIRGQNPETHRDTGIIDLRRSAESIFASFSKKTRRKIRHAERFNVKIRPAKDLDEACVVLNLLQNMGAKYGFKAPGFSEFKATFENVLIKEDLGLFQIAYYDTTILGGDWTIRGPQYAHSLWVALARQQIKELYLTSVSIDPFLIWKSILWAKEKGCEFMDLEGIIKDIDSLDKKHPYYNIAKGKADFNPCSVRVLRQHCNVNNSFTWLISEGQKFFLEGSKITIKKLHRLIR